VTPPRPASSDMPTPPTWLRQAHAAPTAQIRSPRPPDSPSLLRLRNQKKSSIAAPAKIRWEADRPCGGQHEVDPVAVVDEEGRRLDGGGDDLLDVKAGQLGPVCLRSEYSPTTRTFQETLAPVWSVYREIVRHQSETEGDWVGGVEGESERRKPLISCFWGLFQRPYQTSLLPCWDPFVSNKGGGL
jgi:hypothetical protein